MSKVINDRINNFIKAISTKNDKSAATLSRREVKLLKETYSIRTVQTYLTKYRKSVKAISTDKKSYNDTIKALKLPNSEQRKIKNEYDKKLLKQSKKRTKVVNIERMINIGLSLIDSDRYAEITIGLCLLTGRRMTEILKTAKFVNSRNSKKVVRFSGQLKTKRLNPSYEIYTIKSSRDACKRALKKLRSLVDTSEMTTAEVSRKYETTVNEYCKRYFNSFVGKRDIDTCSCHDLRNIYGLYCIQEHKPIEQTDSSFLAELLGHDVDALKTAQSYQKFYLAEK